jgi:glycerophosphoryl diester phosphodiesterase
MPYRRNWDSSAPLVIAHRGASERLPENTIAAFNLAIEIGADAVELDTMLTADGVPVVIHDQTLERSTNGSGRVSSKSAAEISQLFVCTKRDGDYSKEKVPTLEQVFTEVGGHILLNVELKNLSSPLDNLVGVVVRLVRIMGLEERVLFSSFNPYALMKARKIAPEIRRAALVGGGPRIISLINEKATDYSVFHPEVSLVSQELVDRHHVNGRKVNVWTVNDATQMRRLLAMGVDGLITDSPDIAMKVVRSDFTETRDDAG